MGKQEKKGMECMVRSANYTKVRRNEIRIYRRVYIEIIRLVGARVEVARIVPLVMRQDAILAVNFDHWDEENYHLGRQATKQQKKSVHRLAWREYRTEAYRRE